MDDKQRASEIRKDNEHQHIKHTTHFNDCGCESSLLRSIITKQSKKLAIAVKALTFYRGKEHIFYNRKAEQVAALNPAAQALDEMDAVR